MSRWTEQFNNHQFQIHLKELNNAIDEIKLPDQTIMNDVQELARLKKAITFINELLQACDPELVPSSVLDNSNNQIKPCLNNIRQFIRNHRKEVVKLCEADYTCIDGAANLYSIDSDNKNFIKKLKEIITFCNGNDYCVYTSYKIPNHNERNEIIQLCDGNGFCTDTASQIQNHATRKETITLCKGNPGCIKGINNISNIQGGYELVALCEGSKQCTETISTLSYIPEQSTRIEIIKSCNREAQCIRDKYNEFYNKEIAEIQSFIDTECRNNLSPYSLYLINDKEKRKKITRDCKCNKRCINQTFQNINQTQ